MPSPNKWHHVGKFIHSLFFLPISSACLVARRLRTATIQQEKTPTKIYRTSLWPGKPARNLKWFWSLLRSTAHTFRLNDPRNQFVCPPCPSPSKILNTHASTPRASCVPVYAVFGWSKTNYKLHPTQLCIIVARTERSFRTQPKNSKRNGKKALMGLGTRNQRTLAHDLR